MSVRRVPWSCGFVQKRGLRIFLLGTGVFALALDVAMGTPRPITLKLIEGVCEIRNVQYAAPVNEDLTQRAAGSGDLVFIVTMKIDPPANFVVTEFAKRGIQFRNVLSDAAGRVTGVAVDLAEPFVLDSLLGPGTKLTIPSGQLSYERSLNPEKPGDKMNITGTGSILLPFRDSSGSPIELSVKSLRGHLEQSLTKLDLDGITIKASQSAGGLTFPGVKINAAPFDLDLQWAASAPMTWTLKAPSVDCSFGIPGQASTPDYPLDFRITNLVVDQDGQINFPDATLTNSRSFTLGEASGFDLKIKQCSMKMEDSYPTFKSVKADITLPAGITQENSTDRVVIRDLDVDVENGLIIRAGSPKTSNIAINCRIQGLKLVIKDFLLDLSNTASLQNAPAPMNVAVWMGMFVKSATLKIPQGGEDVISLSCSNFRVEPQGVSGRVSLDNLPQLKIAGFPVARAPGQTEPLIQVELSRNQLTQAAVAGQITFGTQSPITLLTSFSFDMDGKASFRIKSDQIPIGDLGVTIKNLQGRLDSGRISLSGDMAFSGIQADDATHGSELNQITIAITDLQIDQSGEFYLPQEGLITFPEPKKIELAPLSIELQRFGFISDGNKITSIIFSGGAEIKGLGDSLPIGGGIKFEGLKIAKDSNGVPTATLGGIGFKAEILGIGSLDASLERATLDRFGDSLFGDADLTLTCLGDMEVGIGLDFLVAPQVKRPNGTTFPAFFVGGHVQVAPILIQIPPAPPSPPVPLFHILGFSGGFGLNVAPEGGGQGLITEPKDQLVPSDGTVLLCAGLLLADPVPAAPGHVWWVDTVLTLTINPLTIDLTGRAAFLDIPGPQFYTVSEFHSLDRWAEVFMNLNLGEPSFTVGGGADFTFPTRDAQLFRASGEAELRFVPFPGQSYLQVGWNRGGAHQKPVKVEFAQLFDHVADISAECGMQVLLPQIDEHGNHLQDASAIMFFNAHVAIEVVGVATIDGGLSGDLVLNGLDNPHGSEFNAEGNLALTGLIDFGFFEASTEGHLHAEFNTTPNHKDELFLLGTVTGEVSGFSASALVDLELPVKK